MPIIMYSACTFPVVPWAAAAWEVLAELSGVSARVWSVLSLTWDGEVASVLVAVDSSILVESVRADVLQLEI